MVYDADSGQLPLGLISPPSTVDMEHSQRDDLQMEDVEIGDDSIADSDGDDYVALLSTVEQKALELYDRLGELQLELALVRAQRNHVPNPAGSEDDVKKAQNEFLASKATHTLRQDVIDSVMTVKPIVTAVHGRADATPLERDLLPLVELRDSWSISAAVNAAEIQKTEYAYVELESAALLTNHENVELAAELLRFTEEIKRTEAAQVVDDDAKAEVERLEREVKSSRQKWRVVKGTASAIVSGSGVDWARDPDLREMVLDAEDD